jgi:hypothetical protein
MASKESSHSEASQRGTPTSSQTTTCLPNTRATPAAHVMHRERLRFQWDMVGKSALFGASVGLVGRGGYGILNGFTGSRLLTPALAVSASAAIVASVCTGTRCVCVCVCVRLLACLLVCDS